MFGKKKKVSPFLNHITVGQLDHITPTQAYRDTLVWVNTLTSTQLTELPQGFVGDPNNCPIARALKNEGYFHVVVGGGRASLAHAGSVLPLLIALPPTVSAFVNFFDSGYYPALVLEKHNISIFKMPVAPKVPELEPVKMPAVDKEHEFILNG